VKKYTCDIRVVIEAETPKQAAARLSYLYDDIDQLPWTLLPDWNYPEEQEEDATPSNS
jgi:hypothetical protein